MQGAGQNRIDPGNFWRTGPDKGGPSSGRTCATELPEGQAWCDSGPTWSGSAADLERPGDQAKRRSRQTDGNCKEEYCGLEKDLEKVKRTRLLHRSKRKRVPTPIVALVGYTNAGKSTLFNRLTNADVLAKDLLFATLDPTLRELSLPDGSDVILSDTVGFVSDLPTTLVAAFRATLEEVVEADLILHVRDISDPENAVQSQDVYAVLEKDRNWS